MGHGDVVAKVSAQMHAHLRSSVDVIDERRVFRDLDRRLQAIGIRAMTTAALFTYYPPSRRLTVSYAGHPPGWLQSAGGRWQRLASDAPAGREHVGLPLGTGLESDYARRRVRTEIGDRFLLVTDGVLEAPSPDGTEFDAAGVETALHDAPGADPEAIAQALLHALERHTGTSRPLHDDVTIFVGEIVPGPPGPALWHVLRNRLLTRIIPSLR